MFIALFAYDMMLRPSRIVPRRLQRMVVVARTLPILVAFQFRHLTPWLCRGRSSPRQLVFRDSSSMWDQSICSRRIDPFALGVLSQPDRQRRLSIRSGHIQSSCYSGLRNETYAVLRTYPSSHTPVKLCMHSFLTFPQINPATPALL